MPLSDPQLAALRTLVTAKGTAKSVKSPTDPAAMESLRDAGLAEQTKTKAWTATAAGLEAWRAAIPPKPAKSPRATKPKPASVTDALTAIEVRVMARLDALESKLDRLLSGPSVSARPSTPVTSLDGPTLLPLIRELSTDRRFGGLIPVPEVRKAATTRLAATEAATDAALLQLDRAFSIDLKVPNDPQLGAQGLDVPGRGRAYFVIVR